MGVSVKYHRNNLVGIFCNNDTDNPNHDLHLLNMDNRVLLVWAGCHASYNVYLGILVSPEP